MDIFLLKVGTMFALDTAHNPMDLDKIHYSVGLLEGQTAKWYRNIHFMVNEHAAREEEPSTANLSGSPGDTSERP